MLDETRLVAPVLTNPTPFSPPNQSSIIIGAGPESPARDFENWLTRKTFEATRDCTPTPSNLAEAALLNGLLWRQAADRVVDLLANSVVDAARDRPSFGFCGVGPARRISLRDEIGQLLLQAVLLGQGKGLSFSHLIDHPALFPFVVQVTARDLMRNPNFRVQRQGDQSDLVELA